ncbi:MAG TPA: helix-turn-helix transcriptional regulator [Candidatus Hydrogenedentes bacterium]|nr:helix-turn-helix transcriptional regulator [Candidatus Hydrogenedentota bacterium]
MKKNARSGACAQEDIWAEFEGVPTVEEIVTNNTPLDLDAAPEFVAEYLKAQFVEDIYKAMEEKGVNQNQLAKRLGKTRQYVGKILNEKANFTLETLAEFACALGMQVSARMYSRDERMAIVPVYPKPSLLLPFPGAEAFVSQGKQPIYPTERQDAGHIAA